MPTKNPTVKVVKASLQKDVDAYKAQLGLETRIAEYADKIFVELSEYVKSSYGELIRVNRYPSSDSMYLTFGSKKLIFSLNKSSRNSIELDYRIKTNPSDTYYVEANIYGLDFVFNPDAENFTRGKGKEKQVLNADTLNSIIYNWTDATN